MGLSKSFARWYIQNLSLRGIPEGKRIVDKFFDVYWGARGLRKSLIRQEYQRLEDKKEMEYALGVRSRAMFPISLQTASIAMANGVTGQELVDVVIENDLYLITDEVYENYIYEDLKHTSPASLNGMFERTITVNAMSKLFSATGFRLGYVVASKDIIDLMEKYHQYTVAGTNHAAQYGFIEALKMDTKL